VVDTVYTNLVNLLNTKITGNMMTERTKTIAKDLQIFRGIFPGKSYVGGGYARHLMMEGYDFNDIDVFILGERSMESWAIFQILETYFTIEHRVEEEALEFSPYAIDGQYMLLKLISIASGEKYDLVFINCGINGLRNKRTASTLSEFYLSLNYKEESVLWGGTVSISPIASDIRETLIDLLIDKTCYIDRSIATKSHASKIELLCKKHNLQLIERPLTAKLETTDYKRL
jgi:hypothetical protein